MDTGGTANRGGDHLHLGGIDDANATSSPQGSRPRRLPQWSASVEDEHRNAGTNGGQQGKAGQVLALSSECAVRVIANE